MELDCLEVFLGDKVDIPVIPMSCLFFLYLDKRQVFVIGLSMCKNDLLHDIHCQQTQHSSPDGNLKDFASQHSDRMRVPKMHVL